MEKNSTEILREIEAAIASLKDQLRGLEDQLAEYQRLAAEEEAAAAVEPAPEPVSDEVDFTDMEIGVAELPEEPAPLPEEPAPLPEEPIVVPEDLPVEPEPVVEDLPVEPTPAEPVRVFEVPTPVPEGPAPVKPAAPKVDTERMAWRLDKPGVAVKNIRSGISLYDRALFIGTLFKEDYALYDQTIGTLNGMGSLDEAVDYLVEAFPDWNFKSDIVYNFMMAIRKKLG
jgi:hypothetical protein